MTLVLSSAKKLQGRIIIPLVLATGQLIIVRQFWPELGDAISTFLALVALLCGVNGAFNTVRLGRRMLALYALGYVLLFMFFMVALGGAPHRALMFSIVALFFCALFHMGFLIGYVIIVVVAYFVFPFYALPLLVTLCIFYTLVIQVRRVARHADNYALTAFFLVSFLLVLVVFFPLLHFMLQRTPQDLAKAFFAADALGSDVREAIWRSIITSSISTGIAVILGLPLAYVLVRADFPGKSILDVALDVPILIPAPIVGIALIMLVGGSTDLGLAVRRAGESLGALFGGANSPIGSAFANIRFEGSALGIILAQVIVSAPFFIRSAMTGIRGVDPRLEHVARTLGAGPLKTFGLITLPLAVRGVFSGLILCWARSISEWGSIQLIAYRPLTGPTLIYDLYQAKGGAPGPSATVAILMALICLGIFILLHVIGSRFIWRRE